MKRVTRSELWPSSSLQWGNWSQVCVWATVVRVHCLQGNRLTSCSPEVSSLSRATLAQLAELWFHLSESRARR